MARLLVAVFLIAVSATTLLDAKAPTVKIAITSPDQTAAIEIVDASVREFHIWAGPGVGSNGIPQTEGFIADWGKGRIAEPPKALRRYRIAFYTGCDPRDASCTTEPQLSYVVTYVYDATAGRGYVYLPGKGEPSYELNTRSIARNGLEGNWFLASASWQSFITPILSPAR